MGSMNKIKLYGKLANGNVAYVSDEDFGLLNMYRWNVDAFGYAVAVGTRYKMHRLVIGAKLGQIVDHINGNKLENLS